MPHNVTKRLDLAAPDDRRLETRMQTFRAALEAAGGRVVEVERPSIDVGARLVAVSVVYRVPT